MQNKVVHKEVMRVLKKSRPGQLFFPTDFRGIGTESAIKMALSRLAKDGLLERIAHGIYLLPREDAIFGKIAPSLEEIAEKVAQKERVRIKPSGAYALNKLGLSTQVPTRLVYLTDGAPRQIKVGAHTIKFKATTVKKLSFKGPISGLLIQALDEIDLNTIDLSLQEKIKSLLTQEDPKKLKNDLTLAPARIHDFLVPFLKDLHINDRMAIKPK